MTTEPRSQGGGPSATTVLVGGVGELYQGDRDIGRRAVEQLATEDLGRGVVVEDLHYGAVTVAQRLEDLRPDALLLVGAEVRGRPPGTVERRLVEPTGGDGQTAVAEAVQGYVGIDLVVDVAAALGALPRRVVAVEVEPTTLEPSSELTPAGRRALVAALVLVRREVRRSPLLVLAREVRDRLADHHLEASAAGAALDDLLAGLAALDAEGRWGATFAARDRLRAAIAAGRTPEGMAHLDWGLWWALVEEVDRVQRLEVPVADAGTS